MGPQDACRAPSSRKSGGTQRNCGHAARSRGLDRERLPVLACGAGSGVISRLVPAPVRRRSRRENVPVTGPVRVPPLSYAPGEISRGDTHVEFCGDVPSDAGSTPAASTTPLFVRVGLAPWSAPRLRPSASPPGSTPAASTTPHFVCVSVRRRSAAASTSPPGLTPAASTHRLTGAPHSANRQARSPQTSHAFGSSKLRVAATRTLQALTG